MLTDFPVETGAEFSPCRRYRYRLWRTWDASLPACAFIGLNPSTADEIRDDPTIRRCIGFARRWGFGHCEVLNLFGWRCTDPRGLLRTRRGSGAAGAALANERAIAAVMASASRLVLAWGSHPRIRAVLASRENDVRRQVERIACALRAKGRPIEIGTLGTNADGSPRHPLYLSYATAFQPATALGDVAAGAPSRAPAPQGERRAVIGMRNESGRG
jgi:hypothetical protein